MKRAKTACVALLMYVRFRTGLDLLPRATCATSRDVDWWDCRNLR